MSYTEYFELVKYIQEVFKDEEGVTIGPTPSADAGLKKEWDKVVKAVIYVKDNKRISKTKFKKKVFSYLSIKGLKPKRTYIAGMTGIIYLYIEFKKPFPETWNEHYLKLNKDLF